MILGVQYYRPPFPLDNFWEEDMRRIKEAGLDAVQLWVLWSWVEAKPGVYRFEDYDRLIELASRNNLKIVLSTIAELQPLWIHREIPGSEMIDHNGHKVVSTNRTECHFGITPGGCFDHPEVWKRMTDFIGTVVERYHSLPNLHGWDCWNELRWNVQSDGYVCFCQHTLDSFHEWLDKKYNGINGLNAAWHRRYNSWDEVWPGKVPGRPYTEMMAFEHFTTWRSDEHGKARYRLIKGIDKTHPVTLHGGDPTPFKPGDDLFTHALDRGNDWAYADTVDGIGCSSFPKWVNMDDAEFGMRVEFVRSAGRDKLIWLSEVQGARGSAGFDLTPAVDALSQQRWIWNGMACGAQTIIFWAWRDEVFGSESAGFGISGDDGFAGERIAAMKETGKLTKQYAELLDAYKPVKPTVGVFFSPQTYYLYWAQEGHARRPRDGLFGYARSLVRNSIPYIVVEEEHLDELDNLSILFLPRLAATDATVEERLIAFVEHGGTLVCESECGAFDSRGIYRYPEQRFTARARGTREVGRRPCESERVQVHIGEKTVSLGVAQWLTPWEKNKGRPLSDYSQGDLVSVVPVGKGRLVLCGAYFGDAYQRERTPEFEQFTDYLVRQSGWRPDVEAASPVKTAQSFIYIKYGMASGRRVVFVFSQREDEKVLLKMVAGFFAAGTVRDIMNGKVWKLISEKDGSVSCAFEVSHWKFSVLVEND